MRYLNLPQQQQDPSVYQNIIYRDSRFWFQRIKQIEETKFEFLNIPMETSNFLGAIKRALFPDESSTCAPGIEDSNGTQTVAQAYIIHTSDPPRMENLPDEEVLVNLWVQDDGLEVMAYIGEDDGFNCLMDEALLKEVHKFITDIGADLKQQMMLLTGIVTETKACVEQVTGKPFQCCGQCEVCHCAV
jgi:hypothetical protein